MKTRKFMCTSKIFFITLFAILFSTGLLMSQTLSENFDGVTPPALPAGWTFCLDVSLSNTGCYVATTTQVYAPTQPNSAIIFNGGAMGSVDVGATVALVSPSVVVGGLGSVLSFYGLSGSNNPVIVGTMSDPADAGTFTEIEVIPLTGGTAFSYHEVTIPTPSPTYIAFKHGNTSAYNPLFIDSITLIATLPVELSAFNVFLEDNAPLLCWETQSETDNLGWNIYRNNEEDFSNSDMLTTSLIPGNGTTTEPSYYNFEDFENVEIGQTYYYWLESTDYSGITKVYTKIAQISIPDPSTNPPNIEVPKVYDFKIIPNPVSTNSQFKFTLDKRALVSIKIYNIKGELVNELPAVLSEENETSTIYWNCKDSNGVESPSGVYFYNLMINNTISEMKKFVIVK